MSVNSLLECSCLVPTPPATGEELYSDISCGFDVLSVPPPRDVFEIDHECDEELDLAGLIDTRPPALTPEAAHVHATNAHDLQVCFQGREVPGAEGAQVFGAETHRLAVPQPISSSAQRRLKIRERNRVKQANYRERLKVCFVSLHMSQSFYCL